MWAKADRIADRVKRATKVLVNADVGQRVPELQGGSVLVQIGHAYFLLTARHVLDHFLGNRPINIASPPVFAPIVGRLFRTEKDSHGLDLLDAGVIEISPDYVTDDMRES